MEEILQFLCYVGGLYTTTAPFEIPAFVSLISDVFIVILCSLAVVGLLFTQMNIQVPVEPLDWQIANAIFAGLANTIGAAESVLRVASTGHDKRFFFKDWRESENKAKMEEQLVKVPFGPDGQVETHGQGDLLTKEMLEERIKQLSEPRAIESRPISLASIAQMRARVAQIDRMIKTLRRERELRDKQGQLKHTCDFIRRHQLE